MRSVVVLVGLVVGLMVGLVVGLVAVVGLMLGLGLNKIYIIFIYFYLISIHLLPGAVNVYVTSE